MNILYDKEKFMNLDMDSLEIFLNSLSIDELLEVWENASSFSEKPGAVRMLVEVCIKRVGKDFLDNNIENDLFLDCVSCDDELLDLVVKDISMKGLNNIFGTLYSNNKLDEFIVKNKDIFDKFLDSFDDDMLYSIFERINLNIKNNIFGKAILQNFIKNGKEKLILKYFDELTNLLDDDKACKFVLLMLDTNFCPDEIIDFLSGVDLWKYYEIVKYLNNYIAKQVNIDFARKIIDNEVLIQYISPMIILEVYGFPGNNFDSINGNTDFLTLLGYNDVDEMKDDYMYANVDELRESFLLEEEDKFNKNVVTNFNSSDILKLIVFNFFIGLNDNIMTIIFEFFKKFVPYEKAIFLVDELKYSDNDKIRIINSVYPDRPIDSVSETKNEIIKRNFDKILRNDKVVDEEFKYLLPEFIKLPYNEEFFNKIKEKCFEFINIEYLQVFLSQLIKGVCAKNDLELTSIEMNKRCENSSATFFDKEKILVVYPDFYGFDINYEIIEENINSCFHEIRHVFQYQKMDKLISVNALICNLELILSNIILQYYVNNYDNIHVEIDARIWADYYIFKFLEKVDFESSNLDTTLQMSGRYTRESLKGSKREGYLQCLKLGKIFVEDVNRYKSIEHFSKIINTFFDLFSNSKIIELRSKYKTLELITNENGYPYEISEIEQMINDIKSYNTNDIEYNDNDRNTKLFYIKYLHNFKYGIENNLINIDFGDKKVRKRI